MKTIKQDEYEDAIQRFFYNSTDLDRAFCNNIQVFGKYLADVCFTLGDNGTGAYIFKHDVPVGSGFGAVDETMLVGTNIIIREFIANDDGSWSISFGDLGNEKIGDDSDFLIIQGQEAYTATFFRWNSTEFKYFSDNLDLAEKLIDSYNDPVDPLITLCVKIRVLPMNLVHYDFNIIRTGVQE